MLVKRRPRLLFVSPRFLLPADSGGKIRTTEVLRNLKGGEFEVTLACPANEARQREHQSELQALADRLVCWSEPMQGALWHLRRAAGLLSKLPASVASDRNRAGRKLVARELSEAVDVAVFDFAHAAVLAPPAMPAASVLFTHNVEAEIFERHIAVARNAFARRLWINQTRKMIDFERTALRRFDAIIAVSERDRQAFADRYDATHVATIATGVDLARFVPTSRGADRRCVFIGSMDWLANVDAIRFFMDSVWPLIAQAVPDARMTVVGRTPPRELVVAAERRALHWTFTGYVDDIRPHVAGAALSVIPLRVGGGTRIKAYEAMAMGVPVVSTGIGVEGLPLDPGQHYLLADTAEEFAAAVVRVLLSPEVGEQLAATARALVEARFSNRTVAHQFERICLNALVNRRGRSAQPLAGAA